MRIYVRVCVLSSGPMSKYSDDVHKLRRHPHVMMDKYTRANTRFTLLSNT